MESLINKLSDINKIKNLLDALIKYILYISPISTFIFQQYKLEKLGVLESIIIVFLLSIVFFIYAFLMIKKYKEDVAELVATDLYEKMKEFILNGDIDKLEKLLLMHKENSHVQITTSTIINHLQQNVITIIIKYDAYEEKLIYIK